MSHMCNNQHLHSWGHNMIRDLMWYDITLNGNKGLTGHINGVGAGIVSFIHDV
jgi:N6-adenosine-specific RNA methylase IME4